jgi:hypothetical protein
MARIVIHKAHHVVGHGRVVLDLAQQLFAGASGADDQDAVDAGVFLSLQKVFDGQLGVAHWVNRSRTRSATAALQSPLMAQFFPPLTALSFELSASGPAACIQNRNPHNFIIIICSNQHIITNLNGFLCSLRLSKTQIKDIRFPVIICPHLSHGQPG